MRRGAMMRGGTRPVAEAQSTSQRRSASLSDTTAPDDASADADVTRQRVGGPLALTSVTLGLLTWPIAFNLGAYGEIFYDDIFRIVVAASILFVVTIANPIYPSPWIWLVRAALAAPMLWLLAAAWVVGSTTEALDRPGFVVWMVLILLVSVPLTLRLLIDMFMPELTSAGSRKFLWSIVALIAAVGLIGFVIGRENDRFMTCSDFSIAGSAEPDNCAKTTD
jgi:hypothetical protein